MAEIIHRDDGRYSHMPDGCNERCSDEGHWLEQAVPAPWQVQHTEAQREAITREDTHVD